MLTVSNWVVLDIAIKKGASRRVWSAREEKGGNSGLWGETHHKTPLYSSFSRRSWVSIVLCSIFVNFCSSVLNSSLFSFFPLRFLSFLSKSLLLHCFPNWGGEIGRTRLIHGILDNVFKAHMFLNKERKRWITRSPFREKGRPRNLYKWHEATGVTKPPTAGLFQLMCRLLHKLLVSIRHDLRHIWQPSTNLVFAYHIRPRYWCLST